MSAYDPQFFARRHDFDEKRVYVDAGGTFNIKDKETGSFFSRVCRFFKFEQDQDLTAVNKQMLESLEISQVAKYIFDNFNTYKNQSGAFSNFITNITRLNFKFYNGSQVSALSQIALKVTNFFRRMFRMESIERGYTLIDIQDLMAKHKEAIDILRKDVKPSDNTRGGVTPGSPFAGDPTPLPIPSPGASVSTVPAGSIIPAGAQSLFESLRTKAGGTSGTITTVGGLWASLPPETQALVEQLMSGRLPLGDKDMQVSARGPNGEVQFFELNLEGGDGRKVEFELPREQLEALQALLAGADESANPAMLKLLACIALAQSSNPVALLAAAVDQKDQPGGLQEIIRILNAPDSGGAQTGGVEADKPAPPPKRTILEMITDAEEPPTLYIDDEPFTLRLDQQKNEFDIRNVSETGPLFGYFTGIYVNGKFLPKSGDYRTMPKVVCNPMWARSGDTLSLGLSANTAVDLTFGGTKLPIKYKELGTQIYEVKA